VVDEDRPEGPDGRRSDARPSQRIRIVGADNGDADADAEPGSGEAGDEAAREAPARPSETDDPNKFGAIPVISADDPPPPGVDDTDQTAAQAQPPGGADADADELELPHWTDPPSGKVPAVDPDEDLDVWAGLSTGPQWKGEGDEAAGAEDFSDLQHGDQPATSDAPGSEHQPSTVSFDDLADPAPMTTEAAGGPPQRPVDAPPPDGDVYPPVAEEPAGAGSGDGRGGDRDMNTAVAVGVGLVVLMFVCFFIGAAATVVLATGVITLAAAEFFSATKRAGYHPVPIIGLVGTAGMVLAAYWRGEPAIPLVLLLVLVTTMVWWLMDLSPDRAVPNIAITLLGVVYIGVLGSYAALLLRLPNGVGMLFGAILATVAYDVGGLFIGQRFGSTPLGPASPNKTLEGLLGGGFAAIVVSVVVLGLIPGVFPWEFGDAFALGLGAAIAAPLGDLCESRLKRDLGIKDMGDILPGHGGVLDRFDALLFVLPVTFYVVRVLEVFANVPS
jgi:phosphatidate cytidylyltransferase